VLLLINFMNIFVIIFSFYITNLPLLVLDYINTVEDTTQGTDYRRVACFRYYRMASVSCCFVTKCHKNVR